MNGAEEPGSTSSSMPAVSVHQGVAHLGSGIVNMRDVVYNNTSQRDATASSLQESLKFDRMRYRESAIENEHEGTCSWLLGTEKYKRWASTEHEEWRDAILWIKGSPGSGKSTIMKYAVDNARNTPGHGPVLAHFFNARGSETLEHSVEGMYRNLLCSLLDKLPQEAVEGLKRTFARYPSGDWAVPELVRMLKAAITLSVDSSITFFVDALDECDVEGARALLLVFRNLVQQGWERGHQTRVCFASRPYPHISFDDAVFLNLNHTPEHLKDIANYIEHGLRIGERGTERAMSIASQLRRKAEGVFMWVVMVVRRLNQDFDGGNVDKLQDRLYQIPSGVDSLYEFTISRYPQTKPAMLSCFRWLLFCSGWATEAGNFWLAVQFDLGTSNKELNRMLVGLENRDMERFIVDSCKGLVEFRSGQAQFVHESVRDFILEESQLQRLYDVQNRDDFEGQSYERLRDIGVRYYMSCQWYIRNIATESWLEEHASPPPSNIRNSRLEQQALPCIETTLWRYAEEAQRRGRDQRSFMLSVFDRIGPYFYAPIPERLDIEVGAICESVISALLYNQCPTLIYETQMGPAQAARKSSRPFGLVEPTSERIVLGHALSYANRHAVFALVQLYLELEDRATWLQTMLTRLVHGIQDDDLDRKFAISDRFFTDTRLGSCYGPLLDLEMFHSGLAIFFLLVLAPARAVRRFRVDVGSWSSCPSSSSVARILYMFIDHGILVDGISLTDHHTLAWAEGKEREMRDGKASTADIDPFFKLVQLLRTRVAPDCRKRTLHHERSEFRSVIGHCFLGKRHDPR